jgi:hypothetical protein
MEDKWKKLLTYLAENMWTESSFLKPVPQTNVELVGLLDKIAELRGISQEDNGKEFNSIADSLNS